MWQEMHAEQMVRLYCGYPRVRMAEIGDGRPLTIVEAPSTATAASCKAAIARSRFAFSVSKP